MIYMSIRDKGKETNELNIKVLSKSYGLSEEYIQKIVLSYMEDGLFPNDIRFID